jgi:RNA polymerase sigma-70 factor (ECF subfamily)
VDKDNAEKLYDAFYMKVFSYVMTLTANRDDAMDITQETFYRAMSTAQKFRGESECFTWLCAIAKNLFIDELRRSQKFEDAPPEDKPDLKKGPEEKAVDADTTIRIHRILHSMEEPYKEVFTLRVFGELPFAEIGSLFGKGEGWARVTYFRAKQKLQEKTKEEFTHE